jgi:hypothetical protein
MRGRLTSDGRLITTPDEPATIAAGDLAGDRPVFATAMAETTEQPETVFNRLLRACRVLRAALRSTMDNRSMSLTETETHLAQADLAIAIAETMEPITPPPPLSTLSAMAASALARQFNSPWHYLIGSRPQDPDLAIFDINNAPLAVLRIPEHRERATLENAVRRARLITAAPDLLRMCQNLVEHMRTDPEELQNATVARRSAMSYTESLIRSIITPSESDEGRR